MKANEFVKHYGWNEATEALFNMPKDWDNCYLRLNDLEFVKYVPSFADWLDVSDLKQLVESHELVEKLGGLALAKFYVPDHYKSDRLKQALADVESCQ